MNITLKCYASLARHLPVDAKAHTAKIEINEGSTVHQVIVFLNIDPKETDLVILNGEFVYPPDRDSTLLVESDTLALWPEVAGG